MIITCAEYGGFCAGVKHAFELAVTNRKGKTFVLGEICHNSAVMRVLEDKGIQSIKDIQEVKCGTVVIGAGGAKKRDRQKLTNYIDGTCPIVSKVLKISASAEKDGCVLIIFGNELHDEVVNIASECTEHFVLNSQEQAESFCFHGNRHYIVVCQTTVSRADMAKYYSVLSENYAKSGFLSNNITFCDTVCPSVEKRVNEAVSLAKINDAVVVIGDKRSANCRALFSAAKAVNSQTFFISSPMEITKLNIQGQTVAITAGASVFTEYMKDAAKLLSKNNF